MTKILLKTKSGADATGDYDSGKVTIKKGSILTIDPCGNAPSSNIKQNYAIACKYFKAKNIIKRSDGRHEVVKDIVGLSPSAASVIVTGKAGSGWEKWKLVDGKPLNVLRQASSSNVTSQVKSPTPAKISKITVPLANTPDKSDSGISCAESACDFITYLKDRKNSRVDLEQEGQWMSGAFNAAGGSGNPYGSIIKIDDLAKKEIEAVVEKYISALCREQFVGYARFEWLFADVAHSIENIVSVSSPATWFTFGRAQKILNIITKYCYVWRLCKLQLSPRFGDVSWIDRWKQFLHVPVDLFTMKHLATCQYDALVYETRPETRPNFVKWKWRMDEYRYLGIQDAVRKLAASEGLDPMCYEMKFIWTRPADDPDEE